MVQTQNYPNPFESLWDKLISIEREIQELKAEKATKQDLEIIDGPTLCERININRQTLGKWRKQNKIPFIQNNGIIRYDYNKVIEALEGKKGGRK